VLIAGGTDMVACDDIEVELAIGAELLPYPLS
jgi:hypothetical protein